jgi:hypothetical protein
VSPGRPALKSLAIAFALISLLFAVLAANDWGDQPTERRDPTGSDRRGWSGGVILFLVSGCSLVALYLGARVLGWPRDRTLWAGLGTLLALMTLVRPWWFWDNYRARWLRDLVGDEATAGLYLAFAAVMIWVGLFTEWTFGNP